MKKIIAILFSSLMLASLAACSAADNSTITSPRMGSTINSYCSFYTKVSSSSSYIIYKCDDGYEYKCTSSGCDVYD